MSRDTATSLVALAFWIAILLITPWALDREHDTHPRHAGQQATDR